MLDTVLISWSIYGNHLFFSDQNNCATFFDTVAAHYVMCFFLFFGYMLLSMYAILICVLPFAFCWISHSENNFESEDGRIVGKNVTEKIIENLKVLKFGDFQALENGSECIICAEPYKETDEVTPLECHESHLFHTECLRTWI